MFTTACHLFLTSAREIWVTTSYPIALRPILILASHICLGLTSSLFSSGSLIKTLYEVPQHSSIHATSPAHFSFLDFFIQLILDEEYKSRSSSLCNFLSLPPPQAQTPSSVFNVWFLRILVTAFRVLRSHSIKCYNYCEQQGETMSLLVGKVTDLPVTLIHMMMNLK